MCILTTVQNYKGKETILKVPKKNQIDIRHHIDNARQWQSQNSIPGQTNIQVCMKNNSTLRWLKICKFYHPQTNSKRITQDNLLHKSKHINNNNKKHTKSQDLERLPRKYKEESKTQKYLSVQVVGFISGKSKKVHKSIQYKPDNNVSIQQTQCLSYISAITTQKTK